MFECVSKAVYCGLFKGIHIFFNSELNVFIQLTIVFFLLLLKLQAMLDLTENTQTSDFSLGNKIFVTPFSAVVLINLNLPVIWMPSTSVTMLSTLVSQQLEHHGTLALLSVVGVSRTENIMIILPP